MTCRGKRGKGICPRASTNGAPTAANRTRPTKLKTRLKALRVGMTLAHEVCGTPVILRGRAWVYLAWCGTCEEPVEYREGQ